MLADPKGRELQGKLLVPPGVSEDEYNHSCFQSDHFSFLFIELRVFIYRKTHQLFCQLTLYSEGRSDLMI